MRMVIPDLLMIIKSFSSVTFKMEINFPVFSVIWRVFHSLSTAVGDAIIVHGGTLAVSVLRNHQNVTRRIVDAHHADDFVVRSTGGSPFYAHGGSTTARAVDSWKRIALPERRPIRISESPLVRRADSSSSPSRMVTALMPLVRGRLYASRLVFS